MLYLNFKLANASILLMITFSVFADDEQVEFDSSFLRIEDIDISKFSQSNFLQPGLYRTSVYLNNKYLKDGTVKINREQKLCFEEPIVDDLNFEFKNLPPEFVAKLRDDESCLELEEYLDSASLTFDVSSSRLDIQIPQVYISKKPRGYTDPALWDEGINAAFISYNINGYNSIYDDRSSVSAYFDSGINIGGWYFRHKGNANWSSEQKSNYNNISSYLEKPISEIKGKAKVGLSNTEGQLFDSVALLGAQLNSETQMLPQSKRGYAPQIRGVARSNARVTVSQNGNLIYETTVSPGEFVIDDLYPSGYGGYLDVVVFEADGSEQRFSVPYDSMAQLLRVGAHEYSLSLGQYEDDSLLSNPLLLEGVYQRGIHNSVTLYGGIQGNQNYIAGKAGIAVGTTLGAVSVDITHANTELQEGYEDRSGQSYEIQYSKNITSTGSSVSLGGYRYSTEGYLDYKTAMRARDAIERGSEPNAYNSKNRFVFNAGQELYGSLGQVQFTGTFENYWDDDDYLNQYQLAYSNSFNALSLGVSVNRNEDENGDFQTNYSLNVSLPLSVFDEKSPPQLRASSFHDDEGNRQQIGLSDVVGDNSQFNYGINTTRDSKTDEIALDLSAGYVGESTTLSASWSKGDAYNTQSIGVSGAIVGHSGGVTLTPLTGDTFALIEAKGAENATVKGYGQIRIDENGYAAVPNLQAYSENNLALDLTTASLGVELNNTSKRVVPYDNAIIKLNFEPSFGLPILIKSSFVDGRLPFGSVVKDEEGGIVGHVAQNNQIFARVSKPEGELIVVWEDRGCTIRYALSEEQVNSDALTVVRTECK